MDGINVYVQNGSRTNYNTSKIDKAGEEIISDRTEYKYDRLKDEIKIGQTNDLVINTKKVYDAFRDTCKEIGETSWNGYVAGDMSLAYFTIVDMMERRGIKVPNYDFNDSNPESLANNNDFLGFVNRIEEFVKDNEELSRNYPKKFFDFTKLYKEKLIEFACK